MDITITFLVKTRNTVGVKSNFNNTLYDNTYIDVKETLISACPKEINYFQGFFPSKSSAEN